MFLANCAGIVTRSERPVAQPSVNWDSVSNETEAVPELWMHFDRRPEFSIFININFNFWPQKHHVIARFRSEAMKLFIVCFYWGCQYL